MKHFRDVDIIRKPDGTLRPWHEHDMLTKYEHDCNKLYYLHERPRFYVEALKLIDAEYKAKN